MRIFNVDLGGETISTQIFMCAGREYGYWLGGFDDAHAAGRPGLLAILSGIEDAHEGGFRRVDLGPGDDPYKYRLTETEENLEWMTVVARRRGFWDVACGWPHTSRASHCASVSRTT
jgi:CelD/BcsL family acetyltransferase involved in cellulose biosynthesis